MIRNRGLKDRIRRGLMQMRPRLSRKKCGAKSINWRIIRRSFCSMPRCVTKLMQLSREFRRKNKLEKKDSRKESLLIYQPWAMRRQGIRNSGKGKSSICLKKPIELKNDGTKLIRWQRRSSKLYFRQLL